MRTIPNLTSIRFFLAFLVVIFHLPQFCKNHGIPFFYDLPVFHKGSEAVYVFFALSGFLIIRLLYIEKLQTGTTALKKFFMRRVLRIFPLYYLVLGFGLFYYRFLLPYLGYSFESNYDLATGIFLSVTFFPNIFATYSPGGILEILWSIGIEEQFYLMIAPLFFILPLKRIVLFLVLFTLIYFLLFFSESFIILKKYQMFFYYFSFSGLCSILFLNPVLLNKFRKFKPLLLVLFILYFTTSVFKTYFPEILYHFFSMVLFGLTLTSLSEKPLPILENKWFYYLGKISYGIYMLHAIAIQLVGFLYLKFASHLQIPNFWIILSFNISVLLITILMAHISYKYYESFFLNIKQRFRSKNTIKRL